MSGIARNWLVWLVFKPVQNVGVSIPIYVPVRYILAGMAGTVYTGWYGIDYFARRWEDVNYLRKLMKD